MFSSIGPDDFRRSFINSLRTYDIPPSVKILKRNPIRLNTTRNGFTHTTQSITSRYMNKWRALHGDETKTERKLIKPIRRVIFIKQIFHA